jgi:KAT8 regulatory NSL complex subunit 1
MKTFVKRLENVSNTQSQTLSSKLYNAKYFSQEAAEPGPSKDIAVPGTSSSAGNFIPKYDDRTVYDLEQTAGLLESELHVVQSAIDSDATLSSSGGESADELITYNNQHQESLTM